MHKIQVMNNTDNDEPLDFEVTDSAPDLMAEAAGTKINAAVWWKPQ